MRMPKLVQWQEHGCPALTVKRALIAGECPQALFQNRPQRPHKGLPADVIPLQYHVPMLLDEHRMDSFERYIAHVVKPGMHVLDLGAGTGVLSFFAARQGAAITASSGSRSCWPRPGPRSPARWGTSSRTAPAPRSSALRRPHQRPRKGRWRASAQEVDRPRHHERDRLRDPPGRSDHSANWVRPKPLDPAGLGRDTSIRRPAAGWTVWAKLR
jgi:hypothetical protein